MDTGNLVKAQTIIDDMFARPEMRTNSIPLSQKLFGNQQFMVGNLNDIRTREDRDFDIHLLSRTKRSTTSVRTYNHQGTFDDSMYITPTFSSYVDKTKISLKLLDKSNFDFERVLANKIFQCMMNIMEDVETDNQAWLQSIRSAYSKTLKLGDMATFNAATDSVDISMTEYNKATFYYLLKSAMRQNNHKGMLDVFTDNIMAIDAAVLAAQGSGNATNTAAQFSNMNLIECNELSDPNYTNGLVIAAPQNTLCLLDWIPKQNRVGHGDYNSVKGGYGSISLPPEYGIALQDATGAEMGLNFALHIYEERGDTSLENGSEQDDIREIEVSLDISRNKAPLSNESVNGETVAFQFGMTA